MHSYAPSCTDYLQFEDHINLNATGNRGGMAVTEFADDYPCRTVTAFGGIDISLSGSPLQICCIRSDYPCESARPAELRCPGVKPLVAEHLVQSLPCSFPGPVLLLHRVGLSVCRVVKVQ